MLIAYHNKPENKAAAIACMRQHREADELVKGKYWKNGKGCAVGCRYKSSDHSLAESVDGVPRALAYLLDGIFEGLPNPEAMLWPERFFRAVPVGADLSHVVDHFLFWILTDEKGILKYGAKNPNVVSSINAVAALYRRRLSGDEPKIEDWKTAVYAACGAAYADVAARAAAAAYVAGGGYGDAAAARAYAAYAASAAAYWGYGGGADVAAAAYAAYAAGDAATAVRAIATAYGDGDAEAYEKQYICMAAKLIKLIENAPIAEEAHA